MKKSFAIIGLGRFGLSLIEELSKYTNDIIGIDTDMYKMLIMQSYLLVKILKEQL